MYTVKGSKMNIKELLTFYESGVRGSIKSTLDSHIDNGFLTRKEFSEITKEIDKETAKELKSITKSLKSPVEKIFRENTKSLDGDTVLKSTTPEMMKSGDSFKYIQSIPSTSLRDFSSKSLIGIENDLKESGVDFKKYNDMIMKVALQQAKARAKKTGANFNPKELESRIKKEVLESMNIKDLADKINEAEESGLEVKSSV